MMIALAVVTVFTGLLTALAGIPKVGGTRQKMSATIIGVLAIAYIVLSASVRQATLAQ